mmetsp:Transcript_22082/g.56711  ORF Transcript_22082/g.56711 Transcript_22082/m.56711 type:complete len:398 (-) Transcript_22082:246-1439(-)
MSITREVLANIFKKLDTNNNNKLDRDEFSAGYKRISPEADPLAVEAKWRAISGGAEQVELEALAKHWGIKFGSDDINTEGMTDEQMVEVLALRGLVTTMAEDARKAEEEARAVKEAEALLAKASLGGGGGGGGRRGSSGTLAGGGGGRNSRRGSRELVPGGGIRAREASRRDSKVVQIRQRSNVLQSEESKEVSFLQAADVGEHDELFTYITAGNNVNVCDDRQETVLHKVCRIPPKEPSGWRELLAALVNAGIDIDYMDKRGKTALFTAAEYGRPEICNWLIANGSDINWLSNEWQTVLHQALTSNKPEVVRLLLSDQHVHKLDDINALDSQGRTPLHIASFKAEPDVVQLLLDLGANPHLADDNKITPIQLAERTGKRDTAALLKSYIDSHPEVK